jgi:hypothetical protein
MQRSQFTQLLSAILLVRFPRCGTETARRLSRLRGARVIDGAARSTMQHVIRDGVSGIGPAASITARRRVCDRL